jgi:hypothetical protein
MPTGYTYEIEDGSITELNEYVWRCARAMGAMVMMRDKPSGARISIDDCSEYDSSTARGLRHLRRFRKQTIL